MQRSVDRRSFLKASAAVAACSILPEGAWSASPNERLRTAHIGVAGMGGSDLKSISSHPKVEVAALCDVDAAALEGPLKQHAGAKGFRDYREMLPALGESVDAVIVSTPDHTHAPAAMTALNLGKPVYCQKPLTHEIFEARQLRLQAAQKKLTTQMGIQVHSSVTYKRAVRWVQSGVIGKVRAVHAWSNKNWGYDGGAFEKTATPPAKLDWELWLGTAAERPYVADRYHRGVWRKLLDFGTGTLGDMGVHIFDTPYAALELTAPKSVQTTCRAPTGVGHPEKNVVEYVFPGTRYTTDTLLWKWYDGGYAPPSPKSLGLPAGVKLPSQGALFLGEGGQLLLPHVAEARLFPEESFRDVERPKVKGRNHYHEWVDACRGEGRTSAGFDYAGPLTESLLLGVVANRFPGKRLEWDAENLRVTNQEAANRLIRRKYRTGFEVENL